MLGKIRSLVSYCKAPAGEVRERQSGEEDKNILDLKEDKLYDSRREEEWKTFRRLPGLGMSDYL